MPEIEVVNERPRVENPTIAKRMRKPGERLSGMISVEVYVTTRGGTRVQENGTLLTERPAINFENGIIATDDSANFTTDVNVDYGTPTAGVGAAASAGASTQVLRADATLAHGSGYLPNAHHNQAHAIDGADHTGSLSHAALSGVTADQHHNQTHTVSDHTTAIAVQDEGVAQGNVATVNFTGAGVTAAVAGTTATVTIAGGGGGSGRFVEHYKWNG